MPNNAFSAGSVFSRLNLRDLTVQPAATRVVPPVFTEVVATATQPDVAALRVVEAQPVSPAVTVVPQVHPVFTPRIQDMRFINPDFARNISKLRTPTEGVPRSQITVPISPSENVTDELLFEEAADASKKQYIPRYRVAQQNVSGQQRYQISLQPSGPEWTLTVHLQKFPAPAIADAAREAHEMTHGLSVILKHDQMIGGQAGAQEEMEFNEVTVENGDIRAVLRVNTLVERDLLYQSLTDPAYHARLIVRRAVKVAVPLPQASGTPGTMIPGTTIPGNIILRPRIPRHRMRRAFVNPRMRIDRFPIDRDEAPEVIDAAPEAHEPLFRQRVHALDQDIEPNPFVFPLALHGYIFGGITATPGQHFELVRQQIRWKGKFHSYYQNPARPYQFYYLPDSFKIARRPESPHNPVMSVGFEATDGAIDHVQVALGYIAIPFVDPDRLQAATGELKNFITAPLPPGVNSLDFEPLLTSPDKTKLRLAIPRADTALGPFDERKQAMVDLRSGIHDSLSLTMPQFQAVFDAIFGGSAILLSGNVEVNLGGDQGEAIPFAARMNDLAGQIFDYKEEAARIEDLKTTLRDATDNPIETLRGGLSDLKEMLRNALDNPAEALVGSVKATFRNAIESPVQINSLAAEFHREQERFPAFIHGLDFSTPIQLKPGEELSFSVIPSSRIGGDGALSVEYDLDGVQVLPDREAVWNAILDPSAPAEYVRTIKVKTFKQRFDPPSDNPANQIMAIVLDFEGDVSVELNSENLEAEADLFLPISNIVLGKVDEGQYRYKVRVIRLAGETRDTEWRTDSTGILFPNVQ
ncbi:hypothetical protein BH18ACI4_BH18ACI4_29210 [soil metagenome]